MRKERQKPAKVRRLVDRMLLALSSGRQVDGIWIGTGFAPEHLSRVERALLLVKQHSPLHYSRIIRDLERIWIVLLPDRAAEYNHSLKACVLDERFVADLATSVERLATTIVHEATHARLMRFGIGYDEDQRARIEAICARRELALAVRLPDSARLQQEIAGCLDWYLNPANADYFRDAAFIERHTKGEIEMLRHVRWPDWLIRARPTLRSIIGRARRLFRVDASVYKLMGRAGSYFHGRGSYAEAAQPVAQLGLRRDRCELAGIALSRQRAARLLLRRDALAISEKTLDPEHPDTAASLNNLAVLLHDQGDYAGARPLYERALAIREKALGPEHPETATSLNSLARVLHDQGDLAGARPLIEGALAINEKALGPEHPATATSLNNLAGLLQAQGDLAGARSLIERALAINEKALGPEHADTATSLNNLAGLLQAQGDLAVARPLFERALAIDEKVLGPEHPRTATAVSNLARVLRDAGYANEAEPLFQKAIAVGEKALGRDHSLTQRYASHYARLLVQTRRPAEALTLAQAALAIHEAASGLNQPWTKDSACVTADALDALGRTEEAKALRERYGLTEPEKLKSS
jgi:tetratricopeptide (TPR) repeat protein